MATRLTHKRSPSSPPRKSTRAPVRVAARPSAPTEIGGGERKADRVAHDLLAGIVSGRIAVGSVLPTEDELAEQYRVNRSVVREAIKLLEVHGLVQPVRRRGTEVLDPLQSMSPQVLRAMLIPSTGRVDRAILRSLLEIRATLDVQMSALAAERRTDADVKAMEDAVAQLRASLGDQPRYTRLIGQLTRLVARASHNPIFEMMVSWHNEVTTDLEHIFLTTRPATDPHLQGMALLVQLIREKDVESTRTLVTGFHEWSTPRLLAAAALANGEPLDRLTEGL